MQVGSAWGQTRCVPQESPGSPKRLGLATCSGHLLGKAPFGQPSLPLSHLSTVLLTWLPCKQLVLNPYLSLREPI